mmetsp:Transcript_22427/g.40462  ORF Transcript_22427/g.40462 Transcript_22427/m.40462 type:complete len:334 (-) Transcript_22427:53-1054(-)
MNTPHVPVEWSAAHFNMLGTSSLHYHGHYISLKFSIIALIDLVCNPYALKRWRRSMAFSSNVVALSPVPNFSARFKRFSISSLGKRGAGSSSFFFWTFCLFSGFFCFSSDGFTETSLLRSPPFFFEFLSGTGTLADSLSGMPNLAARAAFFSAKLISFSTTGPANVEARGATGAVSTFCDVATGASVVSGFATSGVWSAGSVTLFCTTGSGVEAGGSSAVGSTFSTGTEEAAATGSTTPSTMPNSSSSSRACSRFTKSAFSPSVDKPRFCSSSRSSETFIFLTSTMILDGVWQSLLYASRLPVAYCMSRTTNGRAIGGDEYSMERLFTVGSRL